MSKLHEIENKINTLKRQIKEIKKGNETDTKFLGLCKSWVNELEQERDRIIRNREESQRLRDLNTLGARARFTNLR